MGLDSRVSNRLVTVVALVCFVLGVALSHLTERGMHVESVTLAGDTPATRFIPSDPGPHPVALLAHGVTASKETMFRFGEALATAGFECFSVDFPGHGASPHPFSFQKTASALKMDRPVDVFVGHSMGAYAGSMAVRNGDLNPHLLIAVGALPRLGDQGPPLLLLAGEWEEAVSPRLLKSRAGTRLILFPWCDHALEPFYPPLVNAALEAACIAVGRVPPAAPSRWIWRVVGLVLGMASALFLAIRLPGLPVKWAWARGALVALWVIAAMALTSSTWVGSVPHFRRLPLQLVIATLAWVVIWGLGKLRVPRWSFAAFMAAVSFVCFITGAHFFGLIAAIAALMFLGARLVGWIAARRGSLHDEELATAIFIGYAFGQLFPLPY